MPDKSVSWTSWDQYPLVRLSDLSGVGRPGRPSSGLLARKNPRIARHPGTTPFKFPARLFWRATLTSEPKKLHGQNQITHKPCSDYCAPSTFAPISADSDGRSHRWRTYAPGMFGTKISLPRSKVTILDHARKNRDCKYEDRPAHVAA